MVLATVRGSRCYSVNRWESRRQSQTLDQENLRGVGARWNKIQWRRWRHGHISRKRRFIWARTHWNSSVLQSVSTDRLLIHRTRSFSGFSLKWCLSFRRNDPIWDRSSHWFFLLFPFSGCLYFLTWNRREKREGHSLSILTSSSSLNSRSLFKSENPYGTVRCLDYLTRCFTSIFFRSDMPLNVSPSEMTEALLPHWTSFKINRSILPFRRLPLVHPRYPFSSRIFPGYLFSLTIFADVPSNGIALL